MTTGLLYRLSLAQTGPRPVAKRTGTRIGEPALSGLENMAKSGSRARNFSPGAEMVSMAGTLAPVSADA
jgi:hypothetical protein